MTDSSAVPATTDRIAELLAAHRYRERLLDCSCGGWKAAPMSSNVKQGKQHEAHVASLLAVLVADAQNDALRTAQKALAGENTVEWARGATASHIAYSEVMDTLDDLIDDVDPYRKVSDSGEGEKLQQQINRSEGEEHAGSDKVVGTHTPHTTPKRNENE